MNFRTPRSSGRTLEWIGLGLGLGAVALLGWQRTRRRGREVASDARPGPLHFERAVTISRPVDVVYRHWRELDRLPGVVRGVEAVERAGEGKTRWRLRAPFGRVVTVDVELIEDRECESISWRARGPLAAGHDGTATFRDAPGARGTEVHVSIDGRPPGGRMGRTIARAMRRVAGGYLRDALRRFKQMLETGEIAVARAPGVSSSSRSEAVAGARPRRVEATS